MKITLSLSEKQNQHSGKNEILLRCSMGRACRLRAKSGIFTSPKFWNEKKSEFKSSNRIQTKDILELNQCKLQLDNLCKIIEEESTKIPVEDIDKKWLDTIIFNFHHPKITPKKKDKSFFEIFDLFINSDSTWKHNTVRNFKTLKNHLIEYSDFTNTKITFASIDKSFLDELADYFTNVKKHKNVTSAKFIKNLKWFLRWALINKYHDNTFFQHYTPGICKPKSDNTFIVFLNNEELQQLKAFDFSKNERLDKVRDVFLFCCYSGLRYSDVEHLHQKDIYDDMLHVTTIKTDDAITINLNNTTRSILNKYKTDNPNDKALPVLSNQKMNAYRK